VKKPITNWLRYTETESSVAGFKFSIIVYLILSSVFFAGFYSKGLPINLAVFLIELIRALTGKSYSQWGSLIMFRLFHTSYTSYPLNFLPSEKHWLPLMLVSILAYQMPGQASADYRLIDSASYDRKILEGSLGTSHSDIVAGFCSACTLAIAIDLVVPKDIEVQWSDSVFRDKPVKFQGPKQWAYILSDLAVENDLVLILRQKDSAGKNTLSISHGPVKGGALIYETPKTPKYLAESTKRFVLIAGTSLPENLARWAAMEKKSISWELERQPIIDFDATFNGNLLDAMQQVIEAYKAQGLLREAVIQPASNNVIVFKASAKGEY
jgi:hypothetical protein